jgi:hypothetical protein
MKRGFKPLLFILAATLVNMLLITGFFVVLFFVYARYIMPHLPPDRVPWGFPVIFILSIGLSFTVYRLLVKAFFARIKAASLPD